MKGGSGEGPVVRSVRFAIPLVKSSNMLIRVAIIQVIHSLSCAISSVVGGDFPLLSQRKMNDAERAAFKMFLSTLCA